MTKPYKYVGPEDIRQRATGQPPGTEIQRPSDVLTWARTSQPQLDRAELLPATFVIDSRERLLIADRHSEHVACAAGHDVLSAGEIFFSLSGPTPTVAEISNQSTGYCPEPESWPLVARVLDTIGLARPNHFTTPCVFRRCPACHERNIVKHDWYHCALCNHALPREWNF